MKTQELKIGNYVNHIYNNELVTDVIADVGYHLLSSPKSTTSRKDSDVVKELKPIPLTEEWLLKFGFVNDGYGEWMKDRYTLDCEYTDKGVYNFVIDNRTYLDIDIKHVHQLQNLYFALTNTELILKQ